MTLLQSPGEGCINLGQRFGLLSSLISENFDSAWSVEPIGPRHRQAQLGWASAEGVAVSRAQMSPMRLVNGGTSGTRALKYYTYLSDQTTRLTLAGRTRVTVCPGELLILSSAMSGEWVVERDYTCSSLVFDSDVFREHVPDPKPILGRKLSLPFHLSDVLVSTMESAWALGCEGLFDSAGPKLMHSFLGMLSLLALPGAWQTQSPQSVLQIRRDQIKAFIRRNFGQSTLNVARLAAQFGLSPRYIAMAFEADAYSPSQYLRHVRLIESARRLRDAGFVNHSITQISFDCGFNSSAHFSNEFKREFGQSPREFRQLAQVEQKSQQA